MSFIIPIKARQYTSLAFGRRCREAGIRPWMGSVDDAYNNALCESFFATLECELLDRQRFRSPLDARLAIFDFIEGWYNPCRRRSALEYLSPLAYEKPSYYRYQAESSEPSTKPGQLHTGDEARAKSHNCDAARLARRRELEILRDPSRALLPPCGPKSGQGVRRVRSIAWMGRAPGSH
jgi:hypothetical protein